jgi:hypothetical protein
MRPPDLSSGFLLALLLLSLGGCLQPGPLPEEAVSGDYAEDLARLRWKSLHELPPGTHLQSTAEDEGVEWKVSLQLLGERGAILEPQLAEYLVGKRTGEVRITQDYALLIARRDPEAGALLNAHSNASLLLHFLEGEGMGSPNQTFWELLVVEGQERVANVLIDAQGETVRKVRKRRVITFEGRG